MPLFGPLHVSLLALIAAVAITLTWLCRKRLVPTRALRIALGWSIAANELIWWAFRYSHEGFRFPFNLPLQLCDVGVWASCLACLTVAPVIVEFAYFTGLAGAGMALLTPDLWSPWPSYPAVYFFIAHGLIVVSVVVLIFGGLSTLRPGAVWRSFGLLVVYASLVGVFDATFHTNYMYLRAKPKSASLLDAFGPWPYYLLPAAFVTLGLFFLLALPPKFLRPSAASARTNV